MCLSISQALAIPSLVNKQYKKMEFDNLKYTLYCALLLDNEILLGPEAVEKLIPWIESFYEKKNKSFDSWILQLETKFSIKAKPEYNFFSGKIYNYHFTYEDKIQQLEGKALQKFQDSFLKKFKNHLIKEGLYVYLKKKIENFYDKTPDA